MALPRDKGPDLALIGATLCLLFFGLVMVYSSSSIMAEQRFGSQGYFLLRQAAAVLVGLGVLVVSSRVRVRFLEKIAVPFLIVSAALLVAVLVPGIGVRVGGAQRWIHLPGFNVQPAELAKLALVLFAARMLSRKGEQVRQFFTGFLPLVIVGLGVVLLLLLQPDFGGAVTVLALVATMLFVAGTRLAYLGYGVLAGIPALAALVLSSPYRRTRFLAFLDPWQERAGSGYQIVQSFLAFGSGGLTGVGLGDGRQKLMYLPEAHTDFVFSVIGEELGLVGVAVVVALYALLLYRGIRIAIQAEEPFAAFTALGVTSLIGLQAIINMSVVTGLLPTKGLTLPLLSYGGSSMIVTLAGIGILLAVRAGSSLARR
jgi:cell division protein FtsW